MSEDVIEVLDLTFITTTPGLSLHHTIRAHEGDALIEDGSGALRIQFGPRKTMTGNEERTLPGRKVTIQGAHVVEMTSTVRMELKDRPSAKALIDKEKAELEKLTRKHGISSRKE